MDFKINTPYQFKYLNIEYLNTPKTKQRISQQCPYQYRY